MYNPLKKYLLRTWFKIFPKGFIYFGHGVASSIKDPFIEKIHMPASEFIELINLWQDLGFEFLSMEKLLDMSKNGFKHKRPWLHLSFDDGYKNNLKVLLPILEERKIPFSVFITTAIVEHQQRFDTYIIRAAIKHHKGKTLNIPMIDTAIHNKYNHKQRIDFSKKVASKFKKLSQKDSRLFISHMESLLSDREWQEVNSTYQNDAPMTIDELKELATNPLVYIGAHGEHHYIQNKELEDAIREQEIKNSGEWLRKHINQPIDVFTFPNGTAKDFTDRSIEYCKESGYKMALTTMPQPLTSKTEAYKVPRHLLSPNPAWIIKFLLKN